VDDRLRPRCANYDEYLPVFAVGLNFIGISAVQLCRVLGLSPLKNTYDVPWGHYVKT